MARSTAAVSNPVSLCSAEEGLPQLVALNPSLTHFWNNPSPNPIPKQDYAANPRAGGVQGGAQRKSVSLQTSNRNHATGADSNIKKRPVHGKSAQDCQSH